MAAKKSQSDAFPNLAVVRVPLKLTDWLVCQERERSTMPTHTHSHTDTLRGQKHQEGGKQGNTRDQKGGTARSWHKNRNVESHITSIILTLDNIAVFMLYPFGKSEKVVFRSSGPLSLFSMVQSISIVNISCETVCVTVYFLQVASESEHCLIKREHEKCMEMIILHNPSDDLDLGKWCSFMPLLLLWNCSCLRFLRKHCHVSTHVSP